MLHRRGGFYDAYKVSALRAGTPASYSIANSPNLFDSSAPSHDNRGSCHEPNEHLRFKGLSVARPWPNQPLNHMLSYISSSEELMLDTNFLNNEKLHKQGLGVASWFIPLMIEVLRDLRYQNHGNCGGMVYTG